MDDSLELRTNSRRCLPLLSLGVLLAILLRFSLLPALFPFFEPGVDSVEDDASDGCLQTGVL